MVHYWPTREQEKKQPPIYGRVLKVGDGKTDVWLLTNLDAKDLPRPRAAQIYRWRWRSEGLFRTYKETLDKTKLRHRTPSLVFREAEGSLLALQLLMAMSAETMKRDKKTKPSPRRTLLRIRGAISRGVAELGPQQRLWYEQALEEIHDERPQRTSSKTRRPWPRRKEHKPPKPPKLRRLSREQKQLLAKILAAA